MTNSSSDELLREIREEIRAVGARVGTLEGEMKSMRDDMKSMRDDMKSIEGRMYENINDLRVEMYKRDAESHRMFMSGSFQGSPYRVESAPHCLGNSATNPDYDIFRDEDYGIF